MLRPILSYLVRPTIFSQRSTYAYTNYGNMSFYGYFTVLYILTAGLYSQVRKEVGSYLCICMGGGEMIMAEFT